MAVPTARSTFKIDDPSPGPGRVTFVRRAYLGTRRSILHYRRRYFRGGSFSKHTTPTKILDPKCAPNAPLQRRSRPQDRHLRSTTLPRAPGGSLLFDALTSAREDRFCIIEEDISGEGRFQSTLPRPRYWIPSAHPRLRYSGGHDRKIDI